MPVGAGAAVAAAAAQQRAGAVEKVAQHPGKRRTATPSPVCAALASAAAGGREAANSRRGELRSRRRRGRELVSLGEERPAAALSVSLSSKRRLPKKRTCRAAARGPAVDGFVAGLREAAAPAPLPLGLAEGSGPQGPGGARGPPRRATGEPGGLVFGGLAVRRGPGRIACGLGGHRPRFYVEPPAVGSVRG